MMIRKTFTGVALALSLAMGCAVAPASAQSATEAARKDQEGVKVVYHINNSEHQALAALRNIRNHLDVAPNTKIVVVAHSDGIEFLTTGYKDADKVGPLISGLAARGVRFEVCEITIKRKKLSKDDFVLEANFTPSGVVRLAELQSKEGYAYIKP
jgi:hypothetical protein